MRDKDQIILESIYSSIINENARRINQSNDRHIETDSGNIDILNVAYDGDFHLQLGGYIHTLDSNMMDVLDSVSKNPKFSSKIKNENVFGDENSFDFSSFIKKHNLGKPKTFQQVSWEPLILFGPFSEPYESYSFLKSLDEYLSKYLYNYTSKNGEGRRMIDTSHYQSNAKFYLEELDKDYSGILYTLKRMGNYPNIEKYIYNFFFPLFAEFCFDRSSDKTEKHMGSLEPKQNKDPLSKTTKGNIEADWIQKLIFHIITSFDSDNMDKLNSLISNIEGVTQNYYIYYIYNFLFGESFGINKLSNHSFRIEKIEEINDKINELFDSNPYLRQ